MQDGSDKKTKFVSEIWFYSFNFGLLTQVHKENIASYRIMKVYSVDKVGLSNTINLNFMMVHCEILNYDKVR